MGQTGAWGPWSRQVCFSVGWLLMLCRLCRSEESDNFHHLIPRSVHSNKWFRKRFTREVMRQGIDVCRHDGRYYALEANMKYGKEGFRAAGIDYIGMMEKMIENGEI